MHILQPKHIKLKDGEVSALLSKFNILKDQLPRIKDSDPALKELDITKGDIVKVIRKSAEDLDIDYFRIVV